MLCIDFSPISWGRIVSMKKQKQETAPKGSLNRNSLTGCSVKLCKVDACGDLVLLCPFVLKGISAGKWLLSMFVRMA